MNVIGQLFIKPSIFILMMIKIEKIGFGPVNF